MLYVNDFFEDNMLIKFRVENYKSFDAEQSLSLMTGESRDHRDHVYSVKGTDILRTAVLFGANASGKSNLVKAMIASRNLILGYPIRREDYCRLTPENRDKPTAFEYTLEINNRFFSYGLAVQLSTGTITEEWLYEHVQSSRVKIFHRIQNDIKTDLELGEHDRMFFNVYTAEANTNRGMPFMLIISKMPQTSKGKLNSIHLVLNWFARSLRIIAAGSAPFNRTEKTNSFTDAAIARYGTGITSVRYETLEPPAYAQILPSDFLYGLVAANRQNNQESFSTVRLPTGIYTISAKANGEPVVKKMVYDHNGVQFDYREESDGTNRLMELLPVLDTSDEKNITYVIDELDRSLHPQLTQKFIKDFESLDPNLRRQLILTVHESRLLDLNLLRRDEIWFINKNADGASEVYSLEEYKERKDRKVDKSYLDGRYGGIPCFKQASPDLK